MTGSKWLLRSGLAVALLAHMGVTRGFAATTQTTTMSANVASIFEISSAPGAVTFAGSIPTTGIESVYVSNEVAIASNSGARWTLSVQLTDTGDHVPNTGIVVKVKSVTGLIVPPGSGIDATTLAADPLGTIGVAVPIWNSGTPGPDNANNTLGLTSIVASYSLTPTSADAGNHTWTLTYTIAAI